MQGGLTPDALDPRTLGRNLLWTSYNGPNNPKKYDKRDDYSYIPRNPIEHPGIFHDLYYDRNRVRGLDGLLTSKDVIGADWKFVGMQYGNMMNPALDPLSRLKAAIFAAGLQLAATPKTLYYGVIAPSNMGR